MTLKIMHPRPFVDSLLQGSEILLRKEEVSWKTGQTNEVLRWQGLNLVGHDTIHAGFLHESVYLNGFASGGNDMSGTQAIAQNLYCAVYGKDALSGRFVRTTWRRNPDFSEQ